MERVKYLKNSMEAEKWNYSLKELLLEEKSQKNSRSGDIFSWAANLG